MADNDKKVKDLKDEEVKTEGPKDEEVEAEEPKTEEVEAEASTDADAAPVSDTGGEGETDQYGRQVFSVTCSSCGKPAKVPFKPSGNRPVYCRDCYMQQRRGNSRGGMNSGSRY